MVRRLDWRKEWLYIDEEYITNLRFADIIVLFNVKTIKRRI